MTEKMQVNKCELCDNIDEVLHSGEGELFCCNEPMKQTVENTVDAAKEKQVPVIENVPGAFKVKVDSVANPMEEKHFIEWIRVFAAGKPVGCF